jgi:hypothetical protein
MLKRMEERGDFKLRSQPLNKFQEHLLDEPRLCMPLDVVSPWMERLRTREPAARQPGFMEFAVGRLDRIIGRACAEAVAKRSAGGANQPVAAPTDRQKAEKFAILSAEGASGSASPDIEVVE